MKKYILIGFMGIAGALCRYGAALLFPGVFPWGTLLVNILGCLLLPVIFILIRELSVLSEDLVIAMGTGFIGAFTTFSSFTLEVIRLLSAGNVATALCYLFVSTAGGLITASFSAALSTRVVKKYLKKEA